MKRKKGPSILLRVILKMEISKYIVKTPWDSKVFGIDTYEIKSVSRQTLEQILRIPGHFTIKVDPLASKKLLHDYDFYYCDTLIEPYCAPDRFVYFEHEGVHITHDIDIAKLTNMSQYAFFHGRFHRDFNIDNQLADIRYAEWLKQIYKSKKVFALVFNNDLAGFFGFSGNKIVLHAINKKYKGKGLAKYLWSAACKELFNKGHSEIVSSISVSNNPALNLYCSLGFRFRNPLDAYHRYSKG